MLRLVKLPVESANTEAGNEPPVVGEIAIVKPVGNVEAHLSGLFVGGIVVFTMKMPSSRIGLKITCSLVAGSATVQPNCVLLLGQVVELMKHTGLAETERVVGPLAVM